MSKVKIVKLENGATIVYKKDKRKDYSAVRLGFVAGHNQNTKNGIAHLLEHLMMKQTKKYSRNEVINKKTELVPSLNAMTGYNGLSIKWHRANQKFEDAMKFSAELLTNTDFDEKIFENEKQVVLEEYYKSEKREYTFNDIFNKLYWSKTPSREQTLGSEEDLNAITIEDLKNYRDKNFITNNFVASYVGNFSLRKLKRILKKEIFPLLPTSNEPANEIIAPVIDKAPDFRFVNRGEAKTIKQRIVFAIPLAECDDNKLFACLCLAKRLNVDANGLFYSLRKQGLIYSASAKREIDRKSDVVLLSLTCEFSPKKYERILEEINLTLRKMLNIPFEQKVLDKYRENLFLSRRETIERPVGKSQLCDGIWNGYVENAVEDFEPRHKPKFYDKVAIKTTTQMVDDLTKKFFNKKNLPYVGMVGDASELERQWTYKQICSVLLKKIDKPFTKKEREEYIVSMDNNLNFIDEFAEQQEINSETYTL